jgi:N-acetylglucosamine kinase-like BadF-type ATPase
VSGTLAVDIGQTGLRLRAAQGEVVHVPLGVSALTDAEQVRRLAARIAEHAPTGAFDRVGVGLSGFVEDSTGPAALAADLHDRLRPRLTVVAADAVTAFLGTIGARAGAVAICGTGVAALGVDADGAVRRVDARGYLLGDFGGGFWVGQRGLHAALDALEGRGPATTLAEASTRLGAPSQIYLDAMSSSPPPRYIAGFARDVLGAAEEGDAVARHIVTDAADQLARTIQAAGLDDGRIGLTGGLTRSAIYVTAARDALGRAGLSPTEFIVQPDAALEGARLVAEAPGMRPAFARLIAVKESE